MDATKIKPEKVHMADKNPDVEEPAVTEPNDPEIENTKGNEPAANESDGPEKAKPGVDELAETETVGTEGGKPGSQDKHEERTRARLQLSIPVRGLVIGALVAALVVAVGVLASLYIGERHKLDAQARQSENIAHAEKAALDYATNAAAMNFQDLNGWKAKLVAGTSPELKDRLSKAADQMEQILVPLQWNSTARPLAAKVRSSTGNVYIVDSFVSVLTKTAQGPDPLQSTATYSVTVDSSKDWQITDVGGIGAALGGR
jgi:Mce-associated membrane protein